MTEYTQIVQGLRKAYFTGKTKDLKWRRGQLKAIMRMLEEQEDALCEAVYKDLRKSKSEAMGMEICLAKNEVVNALNNLDEWAGPQKVAKLLMNIQDECFIRPEPYGVVLCMSAWNYPIQLILHPLIGIIAAGNCCLMKPSEISPNTAELLEKIIPQYLDKDCFKVCCGGVKETQDILKERFDKILYTGNSMVGKIIMEAASKYLTPVLLELGGKSPVYVDKNSDMSLVAQRIAWGRFINCGQTCIAPDYIICTPEVQEQLLEPLKAAIEKFYGSDPQKCKDYGRVVNSRHFGRIKKLLEGSKIVVGGQSDEKDLYIAPTVVRDAKPTDPIMQDEIFGPLLPIMTVKDEDEAIQFINSREKPLAMYVFTNKSTVMNRLYSTCSSGGFTGNDVVVHVGLDTLPFGGVGNSGMGAYHGKFTFDQFSHQKACMLKKQGGEAMMAIRYPPYSEKKLSWLTWLMKKSPKRSGIMSFLPVVIIGVIVAFLFKTMGMQHYLPKSLADKF